MLCLSDDDAQSWIIYVSNFGHDWQEAGMHHVIGAAADSVPVAGEDAPAIYHATQMGFQESEGHDVAFDEHPKLLRAIERS
jgi:hypothetical protein